MKALDIDEWEQLEKMWKENYRQCQKVLLLLVFKPESAHKNQMSYARRGEVKGLRVADAKYMSEDFSFRTMQCLRSAPSHL